MLALLSCRRIAPREPFPEITGPPEGYFASPGLESNIKLQPTPQHVIDILPLEDVPADLARDGEEGPTCAICLSAYVAGEKLRRLPCGHGFHAACGDQWLVKDHHCPCCRNPVMTASGDASNNTESIVRVGGGTVERTAAAVLIGDLPCRAFSGSEQEKPTYDVEAPPVSALDTARLATNGAPAVHGEDRASDNPSSSSSCHSRSSSGLQPVVFIKG